MIEEIYLQNHHSATSKVTNESVKTHQKMLKPFNEMLLGTGCTQGAKVSPLRLQGWTCTSKLQDISVTTLSQVVTHNTITREQPVTVCLLMWCKMRKTASPRIYSCKNV